MPTVEGDSARHMSVGFFRPYLGPKVLDPRVVVGGSAIPRVLQF